MKIFEIKTDAIAVFKERPNRYLGIVDIIEPYSEENVMVHVHDPGRLKELLYKGNKVKIKKASNPKRKTKWDIISAEFENEMILVNSAYHRGITEAILNNEEINPLGKVKKQRAEVKYKNSRIDFLLERDAGATWLEIKGCTLSNGEVALFPDAPTKRGAKHLEELIEISQGDDEAAVYILVLNKAKYFKPNEITDPHFTKMFYKAIEEGIKIYPILLEFRENWIHYKKIIEIK